MMFSHHNTDTNADAEGWYHDRPARTIEEWNSWRKICSTQYDFSKPVRMRSKPKQNSKSKNNQLMLNGWGYRQKRSVNSLTPVHVNRVNCKRKTPAKLEDNLTKCQQEINVFVKTPLSTIERLNLKQSTTVLDVKKLIDDKLGISPEKQELYTGNLQMSNPLTVEDYGIENQSNLVVQILPGLLGGADKPEDSSDKKKRKTDESASQAAVHANVQTPDDSASATDTGDGQFSHLGGTGKPEESSHNKEIHDGSASIGTAYGFVQSSAKASDTGKHTERATKLPCTINESDLEIHYDVLLGSGATCVVYRATLKTQHGNVEVAAKKFSYPPADEKEKEDRKKEIEMLKDLDHPNIIKLLGVVDMRDGNSIIVTELASGGSLYDYLKHLRTKKQSLPANLLHTWCLHAARAVQYLRKKNISHRDIKTKNLLIADDNVIKLCDFGISRELPRTIESASAQHGTCQYFSPESITDNIMSPTADIYALGVVFWELYTLDVPFADLKATFNVIWEIGHGRRPVIPDTCPEDLKNLLATCWHNERDTRPSIDYIVQFIERRPDAFGLQLSTFPYSITRDNFASRHLTLPNIPRESITMLEREMDARFGLETVYSAIHNKLHVTLKAMYSYEDRNEKMLSFLGGIRHRNIASLIGVVDWDDFTKFEVYELSTQESLRGYLDKHGKLSLLLSYRWIKHAALAIQHLQGKNIILTDIKSPIFYITGNKRQILKLLPPTGNKILQKETHVTRSSRGTVAWMAPEVLWDFKRSPKSVIYSLAIVFWEILTAEYPFHELQGEFPVMAAISQGKRPVIPDDTSQAMSELIRQCLHADYHNRPTIDEVVRVIRDCASEFNYEDDSDDECTNETNTDPLTRKTASSGDITSIVTPSADALPALNKDEQEWQGKCKQLEEDNAALLVKNKEQEEELKKLRAMLANQ